MKILCLYSLIILVCLLVSKTAYGCELKIFTTDYLDQQSATVQALNSININDHCDMALVHGGARKNTDLLKNVRLGAFDSAIVPLQDALKDMAVSDIDENDTRSLAKILLRFGMKDATEISSISSDIVPIVNSENRLVILSVMPIEARYALWNESKWDGDLNSNNAKFEVKSIGSILQDSTVGQFYSTPATFSPHAIIMNESRYYGLSEGDREDLISALSEILTDAAAEVQLESKNYLDEILSDSSLETVDFPVAREILMESIDSMLDGKILFNDLSSPFQCAVNMCPCTGSNTCSTKCCEG